jgi:hypothetical protein
MNRSLRDITNKNKGLPSDDNKIQPLGTQETDVKKSPRATFMSFVVVATIAIVILLIIAFVFKGVGDDLKKTEIAQGIQEIRIETSQGDLVLKYKIYERNGRHVLLIVGNRTNDSVSIANLVKSIIYSEGLTVAGTDVMIYDESETNGLSVEEYFASIENAKDPLNFLSNIDEADFYEEEAHIGPVDFRLYIGVTRYSDDRFNVTALDETTYRIELKNGFTEDQFREDFLEQFTGKENLTFIYVDQNDLRLQNP